MLFPLVLLLSSVCIRDQSFRMRQMLFFVLLKMKQQLNDMLQCDNVYDRHVHWPVSAWSVVGEVTLKSHACELRGDIAELENHFAVKTRRIFLSRSIYKTIYSKETEWNEGCNLQGGGVDHGFANV